ncbi:hypothetical protein NC239_19425 [Streptomyces sp. G3]|uniref:hypothetical protein n=1 Tax=unclassified Streptomyces TaxID=2593676 RepID=UPI00202E95FE|nr:hypothetical protein [Streptomyces sp. G3]MCM1940376.1 hypothetical protein [Streptomyces sp. G3]
MNRSTGCVQAVGEPEPRLLLAAKDSSATAYGVLALQIKYLCEDFSLEIDYLGPGIVWGQSWLCPSLIRMPHMDGTEGSGVTIGLPSIGSRGEPHAPGSQPF